MKASPRGVLVAKCEKSWWEWGYTDCKAKEKVGDGIGDIVEGQMKEFAQSISDMVAGIMKWFNTWWMDAPAPDLKADAVNQVVSDLSWYTAAFAILGLMFALVKLVLSQDFKTLISNGLQPIVNLIAVTACYATGLTLLLTAGDKFSEWILDRATTGVAGGSDISALVILGPALGIGGWIIFGLLALLSSTVNVIFMLFRNVLMTVMMVFMPTLAAASGTETGKQAFNKANGYLLAFILFKPVAAVIYALGLRFVNTPLGSEPGKGVDIGDMGEAAVSALMGLAILTLAALALPALMKFLIPVAATGAGAFSGGAALGGAVTIGAGAAVIAATGGAGAGAAGAGAGAGAGSGASTGASAAGGGSAAAGGGAASGAGNPPSGGGSAPSGGEGSEASGAGSQGGSQSSGGSPTGAETQSGGGSAGAGSDDESSEGGSASGAGAQDGSQSAESSMGAEATGSGAESAAGSGAGESAGASAPPSGAANDGGGRSAGDTAAITGVIADASSAAGSGTEKAVEDE